MITIYGSIYTRAFRCYWAAEEAEVPYESKSIDLTKAEHKSPEFLQINPHGKVPAMVDGDFILTESAAICTYIAEQGDQDKLIPPLRSRKFHLHNQWMYFALAELEQPLWNIAKHQFVLPKEMRIEAMKEVGLFEFANVCSVLSKGLDSRPYILADKFSLADIMLSHSLMWAMKWKIPVNHDNLVTYVENMKQRDGFRRVIDKHGNPEESQRKTK